jgi:hypothetical protein
MHQSRGNGSAPLGTPGASPEDRVIALAKKWREADKSHAATKTQADGIKEYRARQALREAIDKL